MSCAVTGHVTDAEGNGLQGAVVYFKLVDSTKQQVFGNDQPRISGSETIFVTLSDQAVAGAGGAFSIDLNGNDVITPTGTMYAVSYSYNGFAWGPLYYVFSGSSVDLDSAAPGTASTPPFVIAATVNAVSTAAGNFQVTHPLGRTPNFALLSPTSSGIWFQANADGSIKMDSTYLYLVAADVSASAEIYVW